MPDQSMRETVAAPEMNTTAEHRRGQDHLMRLMQLLRDAPPQPQGVTWSAGPGPRVALRIGSPHSPPPLLLGA